MPNATIMRLRNNNDAFLAVSSGRADCQILVVILAITSLAKNPTLGHLIVPEPIFASQTAAITAKSATPDWHAVSNSWIDARRRPAGSAPSWSKSQRVPAPTAATFARSCCSKAARRKPSLKSIVN